MFTIDERQTLLRIARKAIAYELGLSKSEPELPTHGTLAQPAGAFVTLHERGELRGCIGYIEALGPVAAVVAEVAVKAAFQDPRFPPLIPSELLHISIEISVLSPLKQINEVEEIAVGVHGILLELRHARGLLLPQVAAEHGWDKTTFLEYTAMKAGLPPDAWKDPEAHIYIFSAEIFAEGALQEGAYP